MTPIRKSITILIALILLMWVPAHAQRKLLQSQYMVNYMQVNPAVVGLNRFTEFRLSARNQWAGVKGAPTTYFGGLNMPINYHKTAHEENQELYQDVVGYDERPHHGFGISAMNDQVGVIEQVRAYGTYAYHLQLTPKIMLSTGLSIGVINTHVNRDEIVLYDKNDTAVDEIQDAARADLQVGFWLHSINWFAGFSTLEINRNNDFGKKDVRVHPAYYLTGGYRFVLSRDIDFIPSVMVRSASLEENALDYNLKVRYQSILWAGLSMRGVNYGFDPSELVFLCGADLRNGITFAYSYDYQMSEIKTVSHGSHEFTVGYALRGKRQRRLNRRNFW